MKQLKLQLLLSLTSLSPPGMGTPCLFWSPSEGMARSLCSWLPQQLSLQRIIHHAKHLGAIIVPSVRRGCRDGALLGDKCHPHHLAIYLAAVVNIRWHLCIPLL